jgi:hypothetical protein
MPVGHDRGSRYQMIADPDARRAVRRVHARIQLNERDEVQMLQSYFSARAG